MLVTLLVLGMTWTTSWADRTALHEDAQVPVDLCTGVPSLQPTEPGICIWIVPGVFYPTEDVNTIKRELRERRHEIESRDEQIAMLEAHIVTLEKKLALETKRVENARIDVEIAEESCPGFFERKVGWCAGVGASMDTQGRIDAAAGIVYGFRF